MEQIQKYQSALEITEHLLEEAHRSNDLENYIRAVIYQNGFLSRLYPDQPERIIASLQRELVRTGEVASSIIESLFGDFYFNYYSSNMWTINERTNLEGPAPEDIRSWTSRHFLEAAQRHYLNSLESNLTSEIENERLGWVISGDSSALALRPNLNHLLYHRVFEFLKAANQMAPKALPSIVVNEELYFAEVEEFLQIDLENRAQGESDFSTLALELFQKVLTDALDNDNPKVLADFDLQRILYLQSVCRGGHCSDFYRSALQMLFERYDEVDSQAEVIYHIANFYRSRADSYTYEKNDPARWANAEALKWCEKAKSMWPESQGAKWCSDLTNAIKSTDLSFQMEQVLMPQKEFLTSVQYKNVAGIQFRVFEVNRSQLHEWAQYDGQRLREALGDEQSVEEGSFELPLEADYHYQRVEVPIPGLKPNYYLLVIEGEPAYEQGGDLFRWSYFQVSGISLINLKKDHQNQSVFVVDRNAGHPISGVEVEVMKTDYNRRMRKHIDQVVYTGKTDREGLFTYDSNERGYSYFLRLIYNGDTLYTDQSYFGGSRNSGNKQSRKLDFFLDRSIYRPGQTVYFKGLAHSSDDGVVSKPIVGETIQLIVRSANHREVHTIELTTNEYGALDGSFTAPEGLTGRMSIQGSGFNTRGNFSVEEYKRPTFYGEFSEVEGEFSIGDSVEIEGVAKAYSGFSIQDANVEYRISRRIFLPWWHRNRSFFPDYLGQDREIDFGVTTTDQSGGFNFSFQSLGEDEVDDCDHCRYIYQINVKITDRGGESHSINKSITISKVSVKAEVDLSDKLDRSKKLKGSLKVTNLDGKNVARRVKVELAKLDPPNPIPLDRKWSAPTVHLLSEKEFKSRFPNSPFQNERDYRNWKTTPPVLNKSMEVDGKTELELPSNLKVGKYRLTITDLEGTSPAVLYTGHCDVVDYEAEKVSGLYPLELLLQKESHQPGDSLRLIVGSADSRAQVLWIKEFPRGEMEFDWMEMKGGNNHLSHRLVEENRGGFYYRLAMIDRGRLFFENVFIDVPFSNKVIHIEPMDIPEVIEPGSNQSWKFKLTDEKGNPIQASVLASMYDQSLDDILPHQWSVHLFSNRKSSFLLENPFAYGISSRGYIHHRYGSISTEKRYPDLKTKMQFFGRGMGVMYRSTTDQEVMMDVASEAVEAPRTGAPPPPPTVEQDGMEKGRGEDSSEESTQVVRENFEETVFFYPQLVSNEEGIVEVDFIIGEAMTSWKMQLLALTPDFEYGLAKYELETSSDLIVLPNWPRFLMQGDRMKFPVRLVNNSSNPAQGELEISIHDAISGTDLTDDFAAMSSLEFSIDAERSDIQFFDLRIPADKIGLMSVQVTANTAGLSDGEKRLVPLLTSQVWITQSFPLFLKEGESIEKFIQLPAGQKPHLNKTTFEYTSDPLWLAFQTLPFSKGDRERNALDHFQNYYVNSMAKYLLKENPAIGENIKKWIASGSLDGELMDNEDLKSTDLESTPWLRDALLQSESRKKLAVLLNPNQVNRELDRSMMELVKLQRADGSFSWFPGGPANWFITQNVLTGIARLSYSGALNSTSEMSDLIRNALSYADEEAKLHYSKHFSKAFDNSDKTRRTIDPIVVQYLYVKSLLEPWSTDFEEWDAFYHMAKSDWMKLDMRLQTMLGVVFFINEDEDLATTIGESIKERSRYTDELGRYIPSGGSYQWFQQPLETHAGIIELWSRMKGMDEAIAEVQQWLLNHRRTNNWGANSTTSRVIESLIEGRNELSPFSKSDKITVNGNVLPGENTELEAGTAWFREEIDPGDEGVKLEIQNTGEGMSWGTLYHQYFEEIKDLDIEPSDGLPLQIERQWLVKEMTESGPVLRELKEGENLQVGQTLVGRIVVESDRSMEYIHIKDLRPSSLEPGNVLSGYRYSDGILYYFASGDSSSDFFIQRLPDGLFVLEYETQVAYSGTYNAGLIKAQSYFAPEFVTYGKGSGLEVD